MVRIYIIVLTKYAADQFVCFSSQLLRISTQNVTLFHHVVNSHVVSDVITR